MSSLAISIEYCVPWNYTARAAWTAQELLGSFADNTASFTLIPGNSGAFEVKVDGDLVFSKKAEGRYPEIRELQQAIGDIVDARAW